MKCRSVVVAAAVAVLGLACTSRAQSVPPGTVIRSDTFTFAKDGAITSYDGSDAAACIANITACPYPYEMGGVAVPSFGGIDVPFQLGYLNNGMLEPCDPMVWQPKVWTIGDGVTLHDGDAYTVSGSTTCPYFTGEYGPNYPPPPAQPSTNLLDGFSVTANYVLVKHVSCRYGRCFTSYTNLLQGGSGVVKETTIN